MKGNILSKRKVIKITLGIIFGIIGVFVVIFAMGWKNKILGYIIISIFVMFGYFWLGNIYSRDEVEGSRIGMLKKKGSVGITILGIIALIWGLWLLIVASTDVVPIARFLDKILPLPLQTLLEFSGVPIIALLAAIYYLISGVGILKLKNWGRELALGFSIFSLLPITVVAIIFTFMSDSVDLSMFKFYSLFIGPLLPSLLFLIFLPLPEVRRTFK